MAEPLNELQWEQLPDMPVGQWEPASELINGTFYVMGGYENYVVSSRCLQALDMASGTWQESVILPSNISHVNLVPDDTGFWFAGGMKDKPCREIKDHIVSEVWHYDIEQNRFSAAPLLPGPRGGGGLSRVGDRLYYVSGLMADRDTDSADHWAFDLKAWRDTGVAAWENVAPMPLPRNQLSMAVLNDRIYAIGGQFNHDSQQLDQVQVDIYDPQTDRWSEGPPLPRPHSHSEGATFVHEGVIWMIGGHVTPVDGTKGFCDDVLTLREGGEWELTGKTHRPISSPASTIYDGCLYVAGGWDGRVDEDKKWLSSPEVWVADVPS